MADKRLVVTERGLCWVPEGDDGIPVGEVFPPEKVPAQLQGARFFETPQGYVLGKPLEGANDQGRKPFSASGRSRYKNATPNSTRGWRRPTTR